MAIAWLLSAGGIDGPESGGGCDGAASPSAAVHTAALRLLLKVCCCREGRRAPSWWALRA